MSSLPEKNVVTTIKDGQIIMDDGRTKLVENLATGETLITKPGERVTLKPNADMSIRENIRDDNGNLISDKNLNANDQSMTLDQAMVDKMNLLNPKVLLSNDGKEIPNPLYKPPHESMENGNILPGGLRPFGSLVDPLDASSFNPELSGLSPEQLLALKKNDSSKIDQIPYIPGQPLQPGMPG